MSRAWLGQVKLVRPWVGGSQLSSPAGEDLECCVEPGAYGKQVKKCYKGSTLVWTSPPGQYPGLPTCSPAASSAAPAAPPVAAPKAIPVANVTSLPTGAFPGAPFNAIQSRPMEARHVFANIQPSVEPPPCPDGPVPFEQWARACAAAKIPRAE